MNIEITIQSKVIEAVAHLYHAEVAKESVQVQLTRKDLVGDLTVVAFPLLKVSKKGPEQTCEDIGAYLVANLPLVSSYNVVKGFLNLNIASSYWLSTANDAVKDSSYGFKKATDSSPLVMIEYSSPNTNKPLHLGHIRNNLLGFSLSRIVEANGNRVVKTNIVNDRGIHICKSMLAWIKWGNGETPASSGLKGDHLVGKYYVLFDKAYKQEIAELVANGMEKEAAENSAPIIEEARNMLRLWEANDAETISIWKMMNGWVYEGFDVTYKALGVDFDKIYYESETYSTGKDMVLKGVEMGAFEKRDDGSVWADLTGDGLDQKLLLRKDGTSVYITQDIGTAHIRYTDYPIDKMVYVVGNEQIYHFQVLSLLLHKLGFKWGKDLLHFSYGMVELPEGKMKSREGTVVDADDLVEEMVNTAREMSKELGKLDGYTEEEAENVYRTIALGALKYFILKVDPKKNMTFNPKESIDFNGNTGPFVQYTYARIQSIFRKANEKGITIPSQSNINLQLNEKESQLVKMIANFPNIVAECGRVYSPAIAANFVYDLCKEYNSFYHDNQILAEENSEVRDMRLILSKSVATIIKNGFWLLGVDVPERM